MINIADCKDPNDSHGRTYRELNLAIKHKFPIGSLVELENGARLFVVAHTRDCDGTPLYGIYNRLDGISDFDRQYRVDYGYTLATAKLIRILRND